MAIEGQIQPDAATKPDMGTGSTPINRTPLSANVPIVTSKSSTTNYTNNVNNLNKSISNLSASNPSIVDFLNSSKMPSDYNSRASMAAKAGIVGYTGSAAQNTQLLKQLQSGWTPDQGAPKIEDKTTTTTDEPTITTTTKGKKTEPVDLLREKIDPSLQNEYDTTLSRLDQGIADAKSNLEQVLATTKNDPVETNAINMIMAKYDEQIQAMKDKNRLLLGSMMTNQIRGGGMQYANEMSSNFMSEEQDKAAQRVSDLVTLAASKIIEAKAAFDKGDVAAFDAASKALESAQKERSSAINTLLLETDRMVKENRAAAKDFTTSDYKLITVTAKSAADQLQQLGIKDPAKRQEFLDNFAAVNGISNLTALDSAVSKEEQNNAKFNKSMTTKAKTGSAAKTYKDGSLVYTQGDLDELIKNFKSVTGPNKKINTQVYANALDAWTLNGGTIAGFKKVADPKVWLNSDDPSAAPILEKLKTTSASTVGFK